MFEFMGVTFILISAVLVSIYVYLKYHVYNYWKRHGIPHESPTIPLGNIPFSYFFGSIPLGIRIKKSYEKFCQHPFHGLYIFGKPILVINDPEVIRLVLIKEFNKFTDRGWFMDEKVDPMSNNLFLQPYETWKAHRGKFSPTFSPAKLRQIYPLMLEVSSEMIKACDLELKTSDTVELKDLIARYNTDIICTTVYGFNCNSLKNPNSEFRRAGMSSFEMGRVTLLISAFLPEILKSTYVPLNRSEVSNFVQQIFEETVTYRRKHGVVRKDLMNLLMQLMDKGTLDGEEKSSASNGDYKLSLTDAAAQAFVFFMGGFETSSSTATYCLLELAINPDIQEKLQEEVDQVADSPDGFTFDSIMDMEYLDMVFNETLRKYPPVTFLNRICAEDCHIPDSDFTIPKGMRILISPPGVQNNAEYFPCPSKFDPTRFTKENLASRSPYVHLEFGEGPRNCIGKRFGTLQTKLAIAVLVHDYTFRICDKTQLPVKFSVDTFLNTPAHGVHLRMDKRR